MCGIAGFTNFSSDKRRSSEKHNASFGSVDYAALDESSLKFMGDVIAHRGPDAHGEYLDDRVGLCHRRLSIIDLSAAGNQPMLSPCENYVLVFNGEIYNFITLRQDLEKQGVVFKTKTDTEIILALYQQEGPSFIQKIHGMFAIALWDKTRQSLFLARDRLGKKPLYYFRDGANIVFGSELKAILQVPGVPKNICPEAVYDFFMYQYIPEPKSIFKNIYKLEPGHCLEITADNIVKTQYWNVSFAETSPASEETIRDDLYSLLNDCTRERMISDVPLGAFLSGGVDSSGIVGLMAENSDRPVTTCSIGFEAKKFDETQFADIIAKKFATDHHEMIVKEDTTAKIEEIARYFDEPFADPSLVPTFFVSQLARRHVTVALAGDGGDENFAGYEKYSIDHVENTLRSKFPQSVRDNIFPPLARAMHGIPSRLAQRGHTLLDTLSRNAGYGFYLTNSFCSQGLWDDLAQDSLKADIGEYHPSNVMQRFYDEADTDDHLSKILYTDIKTYLVGDILVKIDRMSMANSLEVRAPILDHKVVEFSAKIPYGLKYNKGEKKYILKEAFKKLLPDDTLYRKKMGFSVPLAQWFRQEIKSFTEQKLFGNDTGVSQFFKMDVLEDVWQKHQSGKFDYSSPLWSFLMFELWWQNYMTPSKNVEAA